MSQWSPMEVAGQTSKGTMNRRRCLWLQNSAIQVMFILLMLLQPRDVAGMQVRRACFPAETIFWLRFNETEQTYRPVPAVNDRSRNQSIIRVRICHCSLDERWGRGNSSAERVVCDAATTNACGYSTETGATLQCIRLPPATLAYWQHSIDFLFALLIVWLCFTTPGRRAVQYVVSRIIQLAGGCGVIGTLLKSQDHPSGETFRYDSHGDYWNSWQLRRLCRRNPGEARRRMWSQLLYARRRANVSTDPSDEDLFSVELLRQIQAVARWDINNRPTLAGPAGSSEQTAETGEDGNTPPFSSTLLRDPVALNLKTRIYRSRRKEVGQEPAEDAASAATLLVGASSYIVSGPSTMDGEITNHHDDDCIICFQPLLDGHRVGVLPNCDHVFHTDCLKTWCRQRNACPLCQEPVAEAQYSSHADV